MFDCNGPVRLERSGWQSRLKAGDTVTFRFPVAESAGGPRPKARPCLVLDVMEVDGQRHALVAYGTSARTKANRGLEVEVRGAARASAGLDRRTRFVCVRRVLLPLSDPAFTICVARDTPVLGCLTDGPLRRLEVVLAQLAAERDGAAGLGTCNVPRMAQRTRPLRHRPWPRLSASRKGGRASRGESDHVTAAHLAATCAADA